jgi:3-deoxy-D-manno-octulosonic acid (KDO) 8-phosphate synthase
VLSRAAVAVGIDGLFLEVHESPERALSDGSASWTRWSRGRISSTLDARQTSSLTGGSSLKLCLRAERAAASP